MALLLAFVSTLLSSGFGFTPSNSFIAQTTYQVADKKSSKLWDSKFDRALDDFMGKRYGNGESFYGKRLSDLSDDEYANLDMNKKRADRKNLDRPLKDNAILLSGDPKEDLVQWIALELLEKGFRVRIVCQKIDDAVKVLGLPGENVDLLEVQADSSEELYAKTVKGIQAIILCDNFKPVLFGSSDDKLNVARRIISLSEKAMAAKVGTVKKVVVLSRYVPSLSDGGSNNNFLQVLAGSLFDDDELEADSSAFNNFRTAHETFEDEVKQIKAFDYVVVRAPSIVSNTRPGAREQLMAYTENCRISTDIADNGLNKVPFSISALDLSEAVVQSLLIDQVKNTAFTVCAAPSNIQSNLPQRFPRNSYYGILALDDDASRLAALASIQEEIKTEVVTPDQDTDPSMDEPLGVRGQRKQSVVMYDPDGDTPEKRRMAKEKVTAEMKIDRAYSEMRSVYMIRPAESYMSQMEEDVAVEKYWTELLADVSKSKK